MDAEEETDDSSDHGSSEPDLQCLFDASPDFLSASRDKPFARGMVTMEASNVRLHNIIVIGHGTIHHPRLSLYVSQSITHSRVSLHRISLWLSQSSTDDGVDPPASGNIHGTTLVDVMTDETINHWRSSMSRFCRITWPSKVKGTTPSSTPVRGGHAPAASAITKAARRVTFPLEATVDLTTSNSYDSQSESTTLLSFLKAGSDAAPKNESLHRGGLTKATARPLSTNPDRALKQGSVLLFRVLKHRPVCFTGTPRPWRTQLTPAHFVIMFGSLHSVDIRLFADVLVETTREIADRIMETNMAYEQTSPMDRPVDYDLVGGSSTRMRSCLENFLSFLDSAFYLQPAILVELVTTMERLVTGCDAMCPDPLTLKAAYIRWVTMYHFQRHISDVIEQVVGCTDCSITTDWVITQCRTYALPFLHSALFNLLQEVRITPSVESLPVSMKSFPQPKVPTSRIKLEHISPAGGGSSRGDPTPAIRLSPETKREATTPDGKRGFCMHFFSTTKCQKTAATCRLSHQEPSNEGQRATLKRLFQTQGRDLTLQPKYKM